MKPDPARKQKSSSIDFLITDEETIDQQKTSYSGTEKAARLLLSISPEDAARILKELGDDEIVKITTEIARIKKVSPEERKRLLAEFKEEVDQLEMPVKGGPEQARKILEQSLGAAKADEVFSRIHGPEFNTDLAFLETIDPPIIATALQAEHPQIAAVTLSSVKPQLAASILKHLSPEFRADTAHRIAKTSRIHPEAIMRVATVLKEKLEKRKHEFYSETGGAETLAGILNHIDKNLEDQILDDLAGKEPDLIETIKDRLYTFEELTGLDPKELRLVLSQIDDDTILASALRGAGEEMRRAYFNCLSQNRAADILDEMSHRGPLSIREINEARSYVLAIARKLDDEGRIVIKKEKEDYI